MQQDIARSRAKAKMGSDKVTVHMYVCTLCGLTGTCDGVIVAQVPVTE